jgi:hypothetical protein
MNESDRDPSFLTVKLATIIGFNPSSIVKYEHSVIKTDAMLLQVALGFCNIPFDLN